MNEKLIWHARFRFSYSAYWRRFLFGGWRWVENGPDWWDTDAVFRRMWTGSWTLPVGRPMAWLGVEQTNDSWKKQMIIPRIKAMISRRIKLDSWKKQGG